ncbi:MAG: PD-(D/E)XK nuclease family protein [Candidatus Helarchaeota archaeon]
MNKVICNSTNEVVSMDYCKECALKGAPCGYGYALIKRIHKALQPRSGIHVTDLVHCLRRSFYDKTQPMPERPSDAMYRILGTATHSLLEDEADEHLMTETPLEYKGVVGTVDAFYPETGTIVDYKTTRWLKKANLPYGDHEMQVNVYRWLLENNGYKVNRIFLQYIDLSGPTKCRKCKLPLVERGGILVCPACGKEYRGGHNGTARINVPIMLMEEVDQFVLSRKKALEDAIESGIAPESSPGFLCNFCQFSHICPDSESRVQRKETF